MTSDDPPADEWKRRERALAMGIVLWATAVAFVLVVSPTVVTDFVLAHEPHIVAGTILFTIGTCGAIGHGVLLLASSYVESDTEDLTSVPWDE